MVAYNGEDGVFCLPIPLAEIDLFRRRLPILVGLKELGSSTGRSNGKEDRFIAVFIETALSRYRFDNTLLSSVIVLLGLLFVPPLLLLLVGGGNS